MSENKRLRILVVEDEYIIAQDMCRQLMKVGFDVIGPTGSAEGALELIQKNSIDGAVLDVSLNGENIAPVVDVLTKQEITFVFATGYDASALPQAWRHIPRFEKPVDCDSLARALRGKVS